jgi:uncharacterized protein (TIGR03435 family)
MNWIATLASLSLTMAAFGQPAAPEFEVASVKPAAPVVSRGRGGGTGAWGINVDPGLVTFTNVTLKILIHYAYGMTGEASDDPQITGGPSWLDGQTYDVSGKATSAAGRDEMMLMLRKLLADRFQLKFHWEPKEAFVYSLVVGKGGPKFHEAKDDGNPRALTHVTMAQFAMMLMGTEATGHTRAIDRTGLTGTYDLTMKLAPEPGVSIMDAWVAAMPSQLGLELKRDKGTIQMFTIDHVEKTPSAN